MRWLGCCSIPPSADSSVSTSGHLPGSWVSVWSHSCRDLANLCLAALASGGVETHPGPIQRHTCTPECNMINCVHYPYTNRPHTASSQTDHTRKHMLVHFEMWPPPPLLKCLGHQSRPLCQGTGNRDASNPLAIGRSFITAEGRRKRGEGEREREGEEGGKEKGVGVTDRGNSADKWPPKFSINQQLICCPFKANTT